MYAVHKYNQNKSFNLIAVTFKYENLQGSDIHGKFRTNVLVGDLLQEDVLSPDISGVERVSTEISDLCMMSSLLGRGGLLVLVTFTDALAGFSTILF